MDVGEGAEVLGINPRAVYEAIESGRSRTAERKLAEGP